MLKMSKNVLMMVALLFPSLAFGQDYPNPVVVVVGSEKVYDIGDQIKLNVKTDQVPSNLVKSQYFWESLEEPGLDITEKEPNGVAAWSGTGKTKRQAPFILIGIHSFKNDKGEIVTQKAKQRFTVTVDDVQPPAPPAPPEPEKPARPNFLASTFGLNQYMAEQLLDDKTMSIADKQVVASKIKESLGKVYEKYTTDGTYRSFNKMYGDMIEGLKPLSAVKTSEKYSVVFQTKMYDLYSNKKMTEAEQFAKASQEIIEGMNWITENTK